MDSLLRALVRYSEKAASIARALRREGGVFHNLVEEKEEHEKNKKFAKDMKTFADVLIQEGFKHDIEKEVGCRSRKPDIDPCVSFLIHTHRHMY